MTICLPTQNGLCEITNWLLEDGSETDDPRLAVEAVGQLVGGPYAGDWMRLDVRCLQGCWERAN